MISESGSLAENNVFSLGPLKSAVNSTPASCLSSVPPVWGQDWGQISLRSLLSGAPFFRSWLCWGMTWRRKGVRFLGASFVRHLSTINDWHISCHFPLLFCGRWVWEQIMKLTIMCVMCLQPVCLCVCAHTKRRGCLQKKHWIGKGKCQLLSCYCTTILH